MPELPEVEVIRRRIIPYTVGRTVTRLIIRTAAMRRPMSEALIAKLPGQTVEAIERREKYLLFRCTRGRTDGKSVFATFQLERVVDAVKVIFVPISS